MVTTAAVQELLTLLVVMKRTLVDSKPTGKLKSSSSVSGFIDLKE